MRVVLLKDVPSLGRAGDVVTVAEGYARNYLIPRRLAEPASEKRLQQIDHARRQREKKTQAAVQRAEELAARLQEATVPVRVKTGGGNRLFGAVTAKDIAEAIARGHGVTLDKKQVLLKAPLKEVGTYTVGVKLAPGVTASVKVVVIPE
ncbi:MAG: 50S ribosomal protein L9 [Bacillota bacterium]